MKFIAECRKCGAKIPAERLEVLPDTKTCIACSYVTVPTGFMDYSHKTAPELVILSDNAEEQRRARRAFRRAR